MINSLSLSYYLIKEGESISILDRTVPVLHNSKDFLSIRADNSPSVRNQKHFPLWRPGIDVLNQYIPIQISGSYSLSCSSCMIYLCPQSMPRTISIVEHLRNTVYGCQIMWHLCASFFNVSIL